MSVDIDCQNCGETVELDADDLDDQIVCPSCGEALELTAEDRESLEEEKDFCDIATLDFQADGQIDDEFWPFF